MPDLSYQLTRRKERLKMPFQQNFYVVIPSKNSQQRIMRYYHIGSVIGNLGISCFYAIQTLVIKHYHDL